MTTKELQKIKDVIVRMGFVYTDNPDDLNTVVSVFEAAWDDYKYDGFKISLEEVISYGLELINILVAELETAQDELAETQRLYKASNDRSLTWALNVEQLQDWINANPQRKRAFELDTEEN